MHLCFFFFLLCLRFWLNSLLFEFSQDILYYFYLIFFIDKHAKMAKIFSAPAKYTLSYLNQSQTPLQKLKFYQTNVCNFQSDISLYSSFSYSADKSRQMPKFIDIKPENKSGSAHNKQNYLSLPLEKQLVLSGVNSVCCIGRHFYLLQEIQALFLFSYLERMFLSDFFLVECFFFKHNNIFLRRNYINTVVKIWVLHWIITTLATVKKCWMSNLISVILLLDV